MRNVVRALGSAKIELKVTKSTTHVVTTGVRTINLLHGIIRGCWLVNFEWILKSLENNAWLNPEKYEMAHFSKAVLVNKIYKIILKYEMSWIKKIILNISFTSINFLKLFKLCHKHFVHEKKRDI